jgi:hypothetical protein
MTIKPDRHGTIVYQFYLHFGAKPADRCGESERAKRPNKRINKWSGHLSWSGIRIAWPPPFADVSEEGELRNHKHLDRGGGFGVELKRGSFLFVRAVLKKSQMRDLSRYQVRILFGVADANSDE